MLPHSFVHSTDLATKINALIEQQLPQASIGIEIKDLQTGAVLYSKNANSLLCPASSMKLLTAAAALYYLTPQFQFVTILAKKNQDYYLSFSGSPAFTSANLAELISQLKQQHIQTITGNLILVPSSFQAPYYANGTSFDDLGWYYSAPDGPVIVNENACVFDLITSPKLGGPVQIKPKEPCPALRIINEIKTVEKAEAKDHCNLNIEIKPHNTLHLFGCLAQTQAPQTMKLAIPDPILMLKQLIKKELESHKITLKGKIVIDKLMPNTTKIYSQRSEALSQMVTHMLQESDNLYANSLTKQMGLSLYNEGSYKQGVFAIKEILNKNTHMDIKQLEMADGMGSRYNLVTANQFVTLLTDLYNNKTLKPYLLEALPQAGISGTLKYRMTKTNLNQILHAKTGTMHDISSLSGFIIKEHAHPIVFSIIINGINVPINHAKDLEEKILLLIN